MNSVYLYISNSIYDFSYFCCPECDGKWQFKQDFVDHISSFHTWVSKFGAQKIFEIDAKVSYF